MLTKVRYTHILIVLFIALLIVPTIAVPVNETEFIIDDTRYEFDKKTFVDGSNTASPANFRIKFNNYKDLVNVQTVFWKPHASDNNFILYDEDIATESYKVNLQSYTNDKIIGSGYLTYYKGPTTAQSHIRIDIVNINTSIMGGTTIEVRIADDKPYNLKTVYGKADPDDSNAFSTQTINRLRGTREIEYTTRFTHKISLEPYTSSDFKINIDRDGLKSGSTDGKHSVVSIYDNGGELLYTHTGSSSVIKYFSRDLQPYTVVVESTAFNKTYTGYLGEGEPWIPPTENVTPTPTDPGESATLTVYIKNSQTGALIANANIAIDALVDGEYYPVTNRTEPSGIFTITLQPTGGGKPNPDSYRLIATADGYNNPMPEINFTVDDYKLSIYCLLDPIAGGPVNENKTFIDFFVRDMTSNPISGATVKFGKYTLITNSAGYTVFEVDKNNNYSWTISKSGYGPLTGNAVIGNAPRHTINTVLAPIVTPTTTTPIPTSPPIGPTPTMTAPTGEHVSNWLEWFAAHFGMILGGGVEIGKIFMWLCFTVPVGVYVGKEAKAGAAGFMAGAGIVTLFFVLIGWVPIWLVVLLALIIGLLYAKVFNTPDNGGGR
jgi:hypothetical protein